ncbi:unnamed protein product [Spodoptera exigua]|nr:unnamed protein product [Spodoptera exigua]
MGGRNWAPGNLTYTAEDNCTIPGTFFWKPRLGLDLAIPTTESEMPVNVPNKENVEKGLVTLVDGYQAGLSVISVAAGASSASSDSQMDMSSSYFHTNVYRWALRYISLSVFSLVKIASLVMRYEERWAICLQLSATVWSTFACQNASDVVVKLSVWGPFQPQVVLVKDAYRCVKGQVVQLSVVQEAAKLIVMVDFANGPRLQRHRYKNMDTTMLFCITNVQGL